MNELLSQSNEVDLTDKQRRFCEEYLIDLNATQAAIRAGYSKKTANEQGCQNLAKLNIQAYLQKLMAERSARTEIDADNVVRELGKLAFSNIGDYVTFGPEGVTLKPSKDLTNEQRACISAVSEMVIKDGRTVRFKLHDKTKNLELLGRHLGLFNNKLDIEHQFTLADFMKMASQKG